MALTPKMDLPNSQIDNGNFAEYNQLLALGSSRTPQQETDFQTLFTTLLIYLITAQDYNAIIDFVNQAELQLAQANRDIAQLYLQDAIYRLQAEISGKMPLTQSRFFEQPNLAPTNSVGAIDFTKAYCSSATQGTNTITVTTMVSGVITDLTEGMEITLQDDTNKEVLVIDSVSDPVITFTGNIVNSYSGDVNIYRSSIKVVGDNWEFEGVISGGFENATKLTDPSTLPTSTGRDVAFSTDGTYMSVAHSTSPYVTIYKRSGDTFTKLADPLTLPTGDGSGVAFSTDGIYMSVAHTSSPYVTIYKRSGDTFTKLADPLTLPTGAGKDVAFSTDGTYMSVAHDTSPYITIYKRSGDTFTKLTNPSTLPTFTGTGVAFSTDGTYMSVAHSASPYITIYKRSGDTFTKLTNPSTLPTGDGEDVAFSSDSTYMSVAHNVSPYITIYKRSGDTFTKLADPLTLPIGNGEDVAFSTDGTYMSVAHITSPYVTIYKRSGDTFTKLADPLTLPTGSGIGIAFSTDGTYMSVAHAATPYVTIYKGAIETDITDIDIRLNINPFTDIGNISMWLLNNQLGTYTGSVSVVGAGVDENYVSMAKITTDLGTENEEYFVKSALTVGPRVTAKVNVTRPTTGTAVEIKQIIGGVF